MLSIGCQIYGRFFDDAWYLACLELSHIIEVCYLYAHNNKGQFGFHGWTGWTGWITSWMGLDFRVGQVGFLGLEGRTALLSNHPTCPISSIRCFNSVYPLHISDGNCWMTEGLLYALLCWLCSLSARCTVCECSCSYSLFCYVAMQAVMYMT